MTEPATYVADLHGLDLLVRYQNVHWLFINWKAAPGEQNYEREKTEAEVMCFMFHIHLLLSYFLFIAQ